MLSGLFIRMAQHKHAGYYECVAKTPMDTDIAGTTLTVIGETFCVFPFKLW